MCGFAGFLNQAGFSSDDEVVNNLNRMANSIIHRGPDSQGFWHDRTTGIALAHRRLAILDLSEAGAQPMFSADGRYVIAFNGEIYNHLEIRNELKQSGYAQNWRGSSDTETLLAAFVAFGIELAVQKTIGMFAFAVWDTHKQVLTLGRDRIGEKPLYYGWQGSGVNSVFMFGSELKALRAHRSFDTEINRNSLGLFMRHSAVPAPYSIYKNIYKLPPASLLTVSLANRNAMPIKYWNGAEVAARGKQANFLSTPAEASLYLEKLLADSIKKQMLSDVPLGAFLSGGVDSSTIVALMQANSSKRIKTFSIGFNEEAYNEAQHALAVAKHLGTDHTELYVTPQQAIDVIPQLHEIYDEPFSDSSQIPTYLISKLAREHVTVSLSGDGGDELFCGYNRYSLNEKLWRNISQLPMPARKFAEILLQKISPTLWDKFFATVANVIPRMAKIPNIGDKIHKGANILTSKSSDELYFRLISNWSDVDSLVIDANNAPTLLTENAPNLSGLNDIERMMALDMLTYLPDDILTKVDRAGMHVSLETRMPFLDHRIVEFAWQLPLSYKLRQGQTKWILRDVLYRYVPKEMIERPKMGFGVPIDSWLRGPLKSWAEDLLDERALQKNGYLNAAPIREKWLEHQSGKRNWQHQLWSVLMFQSWINQQ